MLLPIRRALLAVPRRSTVLYVRRPQFRIRPTIEPFVFSLFKLDSAQEKKGFF